MAHNRDAIIQAVVKEYNIVLGKDDPIFAFLAVHDVMLEQYTTEMTGAVSKLHEHLEQITGRYQNQSKLLAEEIVGRAVNQIREEGKIMQEGLKALLEAERKEKKAEIESLTKRTEQASQRAMMAMWAALCFTGLSAVAAGVLVII